MSALGGLVVKIALDHAEYSKGLDRSSQEALKFAQSAQRNFDSAADLSKDFLKGLAAQAAATVGALMAVDEALTRSLEFSKSIAQISTQIDGSIDDLNKLSSAAKSLSVQFGTMPVDQSKAFYEIISAGIDDTRKATELLISANKLAIGGNTDLATSVDGLTNIMNSYSGKIESADAVSDALFVGMKAGKATMEELSSTLGKVTPIAATLNVSFDELVATVSSLSKQGISTTESVTGVRAILASVAKPTKEASDLASKLGLDFNAAGLQAKGFAGFLDDVSKRTGGSVDKLSLLFGGVEALIPIMALSGRAGVDFSQIMTEMGSKAGATQDAFEKMAASPGFKIDQLMASINNIAITLGDSLASILAPAAEKASIALSNLFGVSKNLSDIDKQKQKLAELQGQLDSMNNKKHLPFFLDVFLYDKKQADLLQQQIEDGIVDLEALKEAAIGAKNALNGGDVIDGIIKPQNKPENNNRTNLIREQISESERFISSLVKESDQLGKTSAEIRKMQAAKLGVSAVADPLIDKIEQETKAAKQLQDDMSRVKQITDSVANSQEIYNQKLAELERLKPQLGVETYERALKKLRDETFKTVPATKQATSEVDQLWVQAGRNIQSTLANSIFNFFDDGLKGMVKNVVAAVGRIASEFAALRLSQAIGLGSLFSVSGAASAAGAAGGGLNLMNLAGAGSSVASLFKGGLGSLGLASSLGSGLPGSAGSFFAGLSGVGSAGASSGIFSAAGGAGTAFIGGPGTAIGGAGMGGAATMGASFAAFAGPAIALAAVDAIGRLFGGNKTLGGAEMIPVLGGFLAGLFGHGPMKFRQQSLQGTVSDSGFDGDITNVFRAKGGLLVGNKHDPRHEDIPHQLQDMLDTTIDGFYKSAHGFAENLGLDVNLVDHFTQELQIKSEKGKKLTDEAIQQMLAGIGDSIATNLIPSIADLSKAGESAFTTLTRLNNEFVALVNAATLLGSSVANAKSFVGASSFEGRTAFVEAAGGIDALVSKAQFFADSFLSDAERLAPVQERLNSELAKLGLSTEITKDQFKGLVQSFGSINGISEDMLQSLLSLAPAFIQVRNATEAVTRAQDDAARAERERLKTEQMSALNDAFSVLQRSVDARRKSLTEQYDAALLKVNKRIQDVSDSIGKLKSLSDALRSTVDALRPLSRDQAKQQIRDAINTARRGGGFPDAESLRGALSVLGSGDSLRGTPFEIAKEQAKTAILLDQLNGMTDESLDKEQRTLDALNKQRDSIEDGFRDQIERLDSLLEQGKNQIDALNGIDNTILSLNDAIGILNTRILQLGGKMSDLLKNPDTGASPVSGNPKISDREIIDYFSKPRTPGEIFRDAKKYGVSSEQIIRTGRFTRAEVEDFFNKHPHMPRFADGGFHRGGLRIVGERGPELEFTGPSRIASNADLTNMLHSNDVVKELRNLIGEIKEVKKHTERTAYRLDAVTRGGNSIKTKVA